IGRTDLGHRQTREHDQAAHQDPAPDHRRRSAVCQAVAVQREAPRQDRDDSERDREVRKPTHRAIEFLRVTQLMQSVGVTHHLEWSIKSLRHNFPHLDDNKSSVWASIEFRSVLSKFRNQCSDDDANRNYVPISKSDPSDSSNQGPSTIKSMSWIKLRHGESASRLDLRAVGSNSRISAPSNFHDRHPLGAEIYVLLVARQLAAFARHYRTMMTRVPFGMSRERRSTLGSGSLVPAFFEPRDVQIDDYHCDHY